MNASQTDVHLSVSNRKRVSFRHRQGSLKFASWFSKFGICWYWNTLSESSFMKQQQHEARVSKGASKTVQVHMGANGEIKSAQRQSTWRKFKWRVNENMQGKDVQAASETNVLRGNWLLLLRSSFSADQCMDIKKNTFWGARTLVGPNLFHKWRQKSMSKMTLPWIGGIDIYIYIHIYYVFIKVPSLISCFL